MEESKDLNPQNWAPKENFGSGNLPPTILRHAPSVPVSSPNLHNFCEVPQRPDNPSHVDVAFRTATKAFNSGESRPYAWRIDKLKCLIEGIEEMKKELCEALHLDLGKGEFENWTYELHLCIRDA